MRLHFFITFECKKGPKVGIRYSTHDLISDVIDQLVRLKLRLGKTAVR